MSRLLLATGNSHKLRELKSLLQGLLYEMVSPVDIGINTKIDEVGNSLEENAKLKATAMAAESRLISLADDSGLEVGTLNGEPGVLSARYAGENASNSDRVKYLLAQLKGVPWEERRARFRCVIAIATPEGQVKICSGECHGYITFEPRGERGFGYDPVFYLPELDRTMAELPPEIKNRVSHRGQAVRGAFSLLLRLKNGKNIQ
ncbi:XTP/dITP diphosphatase [Chloroflexota bacterium]